MIEQLRGMVRASVPFEVIGRSRQREALLARTNGDRDHVFLERLLAVTSTRMWG